MTRFDTIAHYAAVPAYLLTAWIAQRDGSNIAYVHDRTFVSLDDLDEREQGQAEALLGMLAPLLYLFVFVTWAEFVVPTVTGSTVGDAVALGGLLALGALTVVVVRYTAGDTRLEVHDGPQPD